MSGPSPIKPTRADDEPIARLGSHGLLARNLGTMVDRRRSKLIVLSIWFVLPISVATCARKIDKVGIPAPASRREQPGQNSICCKGLFAVLFRPFNVCICGAMNNHIRTISCLLYTSPSPRDRQ